MKTILFLLLLIIQPGWIAAQSFIQGIELRNLNGESYSSDQLLNPDQACVIIFWNSYNPKCCDNLENMQAAWINQLKDRGVKLVAICVDCKGTWSYVKPFVNGKAWEFDIFIDVNGDFKRAMGVPDAPYTMLLDKNQNVVCRSSGYCSGNEEFVCRKILHCLDEAEGPGGMQANAVK